MYEYRKDCINRQNKQITCSENLHAAFCKNNASGRNENIFLNCRAQIVFCKVSVFALYDKM